MAHFDTELTKYVLGQGHARTVSVALVWVVVMLPLLIENPGLKLVWINAVLFLAFDMAFYRFKRLPESAFNTEEKNRKTARLLAAVWLCYAAQWGVIASYIFYLDDYKYLAITIAFIMAFNAIGGFTLWLLNKRMGQAYFILLYVPPLVTLIVIGTVDSVTAGVYMLLSLIAGFRVSNSNSGMVLKRLRRYLDSDESARNYKVKSQIDALTNIYNRYYFDTKYPEEIEIARSTQSGLSLLLIDVDHFKTINDRFGHIVGDTCLQRTADLIAEQIRAADTLCRYGGEEFVILLPGAEAAQAMAMSERIRNAFAVMEFAVKQHRISLTVSIGVSVFVVDSSDQSLLEQADKALYRAKEKGRNQTVLAD